MSLVKPPCGPIEGTREGNIDVFRGIPFAQPPTGELRWLPPQPMPPWRDTMRATVFGAQAPQADSPMTGMLGGVQEDIEFSEDCLSLNIWTPGCDDGKRPVMVWIHGGGFTIGSGSSPMYDGAGFASRGVVLVSINYRMGALGFLRLTDITGGAIPATGCEGLLDQIQALNWVHDNISAFGGDPNNVTLFGESAGGMSVGCLMTMPAAAERYHKAIPQSGACHTASPPHRANLIAKLTLQALELKPADTEALYNLTPDQLVEAQAVVLANPAAVGGMPYQPVIDGDHLPALPILSIRAGAAANKPVFVGSTLQENKLFSAMVPGEVLDDEALLERLTASVGETSAKRLISGYAAALDKRQIAPTAAEISDAINTDRMFRMPAVRLAETQLQQSGQVFVYLFNWQTDLMDGRLGACHALELPFVFGTHRNGGLANFAGSSQPGADELSAAMLDAWTNFARTGNPGGDSPCPAYARNRSTMMFGKECVVVDDAFADERQLWDGLDSHIGTMG